MIGDEQSAAGLRDLLEAFPLDPEPVVVERGEDAAGDGPGVLGTTPLVDV